MEILRIARSLRAFPAIRQAPDAGSHRGFTLMEMMVVLAILGVLISIAVPSFSQWRAHAAVNDAATVLMGHLKQARNIAMVENRNVSITFSGSGYTFDADTTAKKSCGMCKNKKVKYSQFSKNLSISPTTTQTFSSQGARVTFGSPTITVTNGTYNKKITLNAIGRVYWQ